MAAQPQALASAVPDLRPDQRWTAGANSSGASATEAAAAKELLAPKADMRDATQVDEQKDKGPTPLERARCSGAIECAGALEQ
jgi:hypothetical protein